MKLAKMITKYIVLILLIGFLIILPAGTSDSVDDFNTTYNQTRSNTRASEIESVEPMNNDQDVSVDTWIMIVFNNEMQVAPTQEAFSISPEAAGEFKWLDIDTLVFKPNKPLAAKKPYTVTITTDAIDLNGETLSANYIWSFTTEEKEVASDSNGGNTRREDDWWYTWEPILTVATLIGTVAIAILSYLGLKKKRSQLQKYIGRLDDIYDKHRRDPYVCEHKLNQLKESLKLKFKHGKLEENQYLILDKKIDDHLAEIRYRKTLTKPKIVAGVEQEINVELDKHIDDSEDDDAPPRKPSKPRIIKD